MPAACVAGQFAMDKQLLFESTTAPSDRRPLGTFWPIHSRTISGRTGSTEG